MTDLTDLLRPLVDRAPDVPPVGELEARVSRRRRRRRAGVAAVTALMAAVVGVTADAAVGSGRHVTRVQVGQFPGRSDQAASVALPGGYVFNSISATPTGLLISGVVPAAGPERCVYASVDQSSLRVGPVQKANCDDPAVGGHTVSVVTGSAGMGSENTARIATVDPATGRVSLGPVVFTYLVASDTGVESVYGGGWMWVYEVADAATHGPEVLQVDTSTGRVVHTIPMPVIYRPILAANDYGLWVGTPAEDLVHPVDTLYLIAPGSRSAVTVIAGSRVVNWLQADSTHLWAGIATAQYGAGGVFSGSLSDEAIWRFNGSDTRAAYAVSLGGFNYESVVGDEADSLWTQRWRAPASRVSPSPQSRQIVRINPDTGTQTAMDTLPPVLVPNATQGFNIGQAAVVDGNLYILEPPQQLGSTVGQYATLTRVAAPTGSSSVSPGTPPPVTAAPGKANVAISLDRTTAPAGTTIAGTVTIDNRTGAPIAVPGGTCNGWLFVGLFNAKITYSPLNGSVGCAAFEIPIGQSRYQISVSTRYQACTQDPTQATYTNPACLSSGMPPLPPGTYQTTIVIPIGRSPSPITTTNALKVTLTSR